LSNGLSCTVYLFFGSDKDTDLIGDDALVEKLSEPFCNAFDLIVVRVKSLDDGLRAVENRNRSVTNVDITIDIGDRFA